MNDHNYPREKTVRNRLNIPHSIFLYAHYLYTFWDRVLGQIIRDFCVCVQIFNGFTLSDQIMSSISS